MTFPQNLDILILPNFPLISEEVVETATRKNYFPTKVNIFNVKISRFCIIVYQSICSEFVWIVMPHFSLEHVQRGPKIRFWDGTS